MRNKNSTSKKFFLKHYKAVTVIVIASLMFLLIAPYLNASGANTSYYVSPSGKDKNDGSIEKPWRTIQKAADTLVPGDTVYVRGGVYKEFVNIKNSGSENEGYITYKAYPEEKPVLDGSDLGVKSGRSVLFYLENANYNVVEGFELRNVRTSDPKMFPAGIRVREGGHDIHLLNNDVHHIANTAEDGNAHGIHIYGNSKTEMNDILIENNEVHHLTLGSSEALTVSGNVSGFVIRNNHIHHNNNIGIDIAGFYNACEQKCNDQARNGVVSQNNVHDNSSFNNPAYDHVYAAGGIYADGATNIKIERNIVYNNDFGIELASENFGKDTSRNTVSENMVFRNHGAGILLGGASESNGGARANVIRNNLLKYNDQLNQGYGEITFQWNNVNNLISKNTIYSNLKNHEFFLHTQNSKSGNRIENNELFPTLLDPFILWK